MYMCVCICVSTCVTNTATTAIRVAKRIWHIWDQYQSHEIDSTLPQKYYIAQSKIKKMTITCKLWLLAVVCVAFLYQDGPQGNGVLCLKKTAHPDDDNLSGAGSSDEDNAGHDSDNESGDSSGKGDSDGGGARKNNEDSSAEDDDDDDDDDHEENLKHKTNKKSGKGKNHSRHHNDDDDNDDDDNKDNDDEEDGEDRTDEDDEETRDASSDEDDDKKHHKKIKKNIKNKKNNEMREVKFFTTTTIKGKPDDILKFLNAGIKPYEPAAFDSDEKSNARLLKKIESITKSNQSSKGKKGVNGDLKHYMQNIIKESSKKKKSKQIDPDEILLALVKNVLVKFLNDM